MKSEVERLRENIACERPEGPTVVIWAKADDAQGSLSRVKEVLQQIAESATDKDSWPNDDEWTQRLPSWFTEPFKGRSIDEVLANENLWDYGSWLDAMRQRGWQWWSSSCDADEGKWTAVLLREEMVYSIDPLIYLVRQSSASSVEVMEE
jgi:hypothetical protein